MQTVITGLMIMIACALTFLFLAECIIYMCHKIILIRMNIERRIKNDQGRSSKTGGSH